MTKTKSSQANWGWSRASIAFFEFFFFSEVWRRIVEVVFLAGEKKRK